MTVAKTSINRQIAIIQSSIDAMTESLDSQGVDYRVLYAAIDRIYENNLEDIMLKNGRRAILTINENIGQEKKMSIIDKYRNKIIMGDCLEVMRGMPDNCVDLVLTDPPYIIAFNGGNKGLVKRDYLKDIGRAEIATNFDLSILDEMLRLLKTPNIIIFASKGQIRQYIDFAESKSFKWQMICWHKTNPTPLTNRAYLPDTEYIFHIWKTRKLTGTYQTKKKYYVTSVEKNDINHPTVKPLQIIKNLMLNGSDEKDVVLDCFSGSGTTAIAAHDQNRDFICVEKDPDYHKASVERLEYHQRQGKLF